MAARRERAVTAVLTYEELRIRVRRVGGDRYLVTANGPAAAAEIITVGAEPAALREQWDRLIAAELCLAPMGELHTVTQLRELGRGVFRLLFGGEGKEPEESGHEEDRQGAEGEDREGIGTRVGACVEAAYDRAQGMSRQRGLRLRFDLPPELRDLPVESLCGPPGSPQQAFALNHGYSLARSLPGGSLGQRLPGPTDEPSVIRLVVACASPKDLAQLRTSAEVAALRHDLPDVAVKTRVLERATRAGLESALAEDQELPTAVVLIAHGEYDQELGKGVVALETESGGSDRVPADLLSGILLKSRRLRLVALNLCFGADSSHLEPFSGLAQALIGGGVPAVVAMRGLVSDASAGAFSPELLKGIAANRTVDESVAAARLRISHMPQHTAVEWATPTLFLHEGCRQGWLFKAREVRDRAEPDPLLEGAHALETLQSPVGHVGSAVLIGAARFQRDRGEWAQVQRILRTPAESYADEQRRMRAEADFELAWPQVDKLCALLAGERDAAAAVAQLDVVRRALPGAVPGCLEAEVAELERLAALVDEARAAEASADWPTAISRYEDVLAARPGGLRDVVERLAAARDELHVARTCEAAERARQAGDWAAASRGYAAVLALRPGHGTAAAWAAYVAGRAAEASEDWPAALAAYGACADLEDAAGRAAYARGRAAARDGDWPGAREAFAQAGPERADWCAYAEGRTAEAAGAWAAAVTGYGSADGFLDSGVRLLYARGRAAADADRVVDAVTDLSAAAARGWDAEPWLGELRHRAYEGALAAAESADWTAALAQLAPLPGEYRATGPLRRYVQGRSAMASGDWGAAAKAFGEAADGDAGGGLPSDTLHLRAYAEGRLCQEQGRWAQALAHFAGLPSELTDVPDRVLYSRGRAADERGEWGGVIDGFGRLPDTYAQGEVGVRRLYARARVAADRRADWAAVLGLLTGVPDEAREGTVAALRRKAEGRRAEEAGDWARACEIHARAFPPPLRGAPLPPGPPPAPPASGTTPVDEPAHLYHYALARTRELDGRWQDALGVYEVMDEQWADVRARRRYVRARIAEEGADGAAAWRGVVEAYEELEREEAHGVDAATRGRYARVRLAEAEGDWARAAAEADALGAHRDAHAVAAYARGRLADAHQEWQRAADAFRQCPGHQDADAHLAYAKGRLLEAAGKWSAAVAAYERARGVLDRADVRCRRLRRLVGLLPWADGLTSAPLVADPFAVQDQAFPYLALRDAGVDPGASMDVVKNASYALLERGSMSWHERVALERLRLPARRLRLDALLYRWHSPEALRDALAGLSPDEGPGLLDALCERFPKDAPLLLLLARDREAAAAEWERRLKEAPGDMDVVHGLAAARLWQAQELEQSGAWEHAVGAWESALAYWATLLSDDEYWDGWRAERAVCYERDLTHEDMASLRWELSQHLFGQLSAYEQRHTEQDRPGQAAAYQALAGVLESELGGARVLKDVGGLPSVPGARATLACGPRYLRLLRLQAPLGDLVASLDAAAQQGKDPGEYAVRELRWAFSELARSFALCEVRKFGPALRALPALRTLSTLPDDCAGPASRAGHAEECDHCKDFLLRNPAYVRLPSRHARLLQDGVELAVHVRLALARAALTRGDGGLDEALEHWRELVRVSRDAGMQARSKKAVIRTVLGRAEALADEEGTQLGPCLDEAVLLVESATAVLHPLDRDLLGRLNGRLSALLSLRGVWRGYTCTKHGMRCDVYGAEADLRRALALNPESSHARDNLARALVFTLDERTYEVPARLGLLHEALGLLDVGLGQALTHRYRETLSESLDELEKLLTRHLGVGGMGDLIRSDGQETPPDDDDLPCWAAELTDKAERALRRGEILWALHHLIRATRADPTDSRIRRALLDAVRRWLAELSPGQGTPENEAGGSVA
ncbi:CHAT domain-containing protein [Streptomyces sp. NRRL S-920]|uniref:CHAT domain-containing protein n=1 Tax=Streptomyces sp. NRRL S-920 TaxID=1463921 RepID=UPI001F319974|nr:CHAT domain-containing protein [Streptomyces sp. NRRL S-920]